MDPEIKGSPSSLSFLAPRQVQDGPPLSDMEGLLTAHTSPFEAYLILPVHVPFSQDHWNTWVLLTPGK